jgi:hypothetical protein
MEHKYAGVLSVHQLHEEPVENLTGVEHSSFGLKFQPGNLAERLVRCERFSVW